MADSLWYDPQTSLDAVKRELAVSSADDDALLNGYGMAANRKIDNLLFPYRDGIPAADVSQDLRSAASMYVVYRYKIKKKSWEAVKEYRAEFESVIRSVIERLRAEPEGRTDVVVESGLYRSEPLRTRERFFGT